MICTRSDSSGAELLPWGKSRATGSPGNSNGSNWVRIGWVWLWLAGWLTVQGLWEPCATRGEIKPPAEPPKADTPRPSSSQSSLAKQANPESSPPANSEGSALFRAESSNGEKPDSAGKPDQPPNPSPPPRRNPVADAQQQRNRKLIEQLGHPDYFVRQRAQQELAQMGFDAFEALSEAEHHEDLEIAARVRYLLRLLRVQWVQPNDPPEVQALLTGYESLLPQQRVERIQLLAAMPDVKGADALCRIARFERFPAISKLAAVALISRYGPEQAPPRELLYIVQKHIGRSQRPAIQWLDTFVQFWDAPDQALAAWTQQVKTELEVFRRTPEQSSLSVAAGLLRIQSRWLAKLGRKKQAAEALAQLVDLEQKGDPETLHQLAEWLWEEKAYEAIEKLAERFREIFQEEPILLYLLAQAQHALGRSAQAQQTAQQALQLNPGPQAEQILRHLMAAVALHRKGFHQWAEQEFRYILRIAPMGHRLYNLAAIQLAEMLHDQGQHLQAAEALQPVVQWFAKRDSLPDALEDLTPLSLQARMHYFYACHWEAQKDRTKQKQALQEALKADPTDVDTLIACYRLPDQPAEWKTQIQSLIQKAVETYREKIQQAPDEPTYYNHLAWLVGNTEGDLDEAIRCAQKAVELSPEAGAYYDTLARVYFARGDLPNALKYQTKAVQLEPHSLQIRRQLEEFQKALGQQTPQNRKTPPTPSNPPHRTRTDGFSSTLLVMFSPSEPTHRSRTDGWGAFGKSSVEV